MAHSHAEETIRVLDDFVCEAIPGPGIAAAEGRARRVSDGMRVLDESGNPLEDSPGEPGELEAPLPEEADKAARGGK